MITLASGDTTLVVLPELGATIQRFRVDGVDVLRVGRPDLGDPLEMSSFPLVPWCNRIEHGRFEWNGRLVDVGGTPLVGEDHGLHGHGWLWKWDVAERHDDRLVVEYLHPAGRWPWRYRARQELQVEDRRLTAILSVTNLSDTVMPTALGFHPYFERPARLTANVDGMWTGEDIIPDHWEEHDSFRGVQVDRTEFDNTFTGWDGRAFIDIQAGRVELSSDLPFLHLFTPPGRGFFCAEPTGAAPGALNHGSRGGVEVAPGESLSTTMRLTLGR